MNNDFNKPERKCGWTNCKFCINGTCNQIDGGGTAYSMDAIGRYKHELQSDEVKQHCRCCIPDLGQQTSHCFET